MGQWLEIVVQFDGAILEVRHLDGKKQRQLTVGATPAADLIIADGAEAATLCSFDALTAMLTPPVGARLYCEEPTGMRQVDERQAHTVVVKPGLRYLVELGELRVYVRLVDAGTACPRMAPFDWREQAPTATAALFALVLMAIAFAIPPSAQTLAIDPELVSRMATFESHPDQLDDKQKVFTEGHQAGGGARAALQNGKAGTPTSQKRVWSPAARHGSLTAEARAIAYEQASSTAVLGALRSLEGTHAAALFSRDSVLGDPASQVMNNLVASDRPAGYGDGGLGDGGKGPGGGGRDLQTIGLDRLPTIGGKGPGGGGYGPGVHANLRDRKVTTEIMAEPGPAKVSGTMDKELIRRVVHRHINEVKFCYERQLQANAGLSGRMKVSFVINPQGQVVASSAAEPIGNAAVDQCVVDAVKRWDFPKPTAGLVSVTYPFYFKNAGAQ